MPNKMILDTETIGLNKPFVYDIGFIIVDDNFQILKSEHYIVKQIYDNKPLFATAYYSVKKPLYTKLLRQRKAKKENLGVITQTMKRLMKSYEVNDIYAYNCHFDKRALQFTIEHFKLQNVFETKNFIDIMKLAKKLHESIDYLTFTDINNKKTETGRPKRTAETTYQFIIKNPNFVEAHISIKDCEIELEILKKVA